MAVRLRSRAGRGHQLTVDGVVTARDLQEGLMAIVRQNGWTEPVLWDFRDVTELQVDYRDLVATNGFITRSFGHLPERGRVAVVASSSAGRAAAMTYRELQPPKSRRTVGVFDTIEEADRWLDDHHEAQPVHPRAMRINLHGVIGALEGASCEVINVSRSGALLSTFTPATVGSESLLSLQQHQTLIDVRVRIVRVAPVNQHEWRVAVTFVAPTEALSQIVMLMRSHGG